MLINMCISGSIACFEMQRCLFFKSIYWVKKKNPSFIPRGGRQGTGLSNSLTVRVWIKPIDASVEGIVHFCSSGDCALWSLLPIFGGVCVCLWVCVCGWMSACKWQCVPVWVCAKFPCELRLCGNLRALSPGDAILRKNHLKVKQKIEIKSQL